MITKEMKEVFNVQQEVKAGSNLHEEVIEARPEEAKKNGNASPNLSAGSFSTYYTWRGHGTIKLNCGSGSINANSRVFVSISEYNTDPRQNRFIGDAFMQVYNVAPYNGGVVVRLNVNFSTDLNVRLDVLVDP